MTEPAKTVSTTKDPAALTFATNSQRPYKSPGRQRAMMAHREGIPATPAMLETSAVPAMLGGGLGDDCYDRMSANLAILPAVLSSSKIITGPMKVSVAEAQFGEVVTFTNLDVQSQGLVSKLVQGGSVPTPYLIRGMCIVGRIVPYRYTTLGAAVADVGEVHVPEVVSPGSVPEDPTALQASFDYNSAGIVAYDLFLRTYQFQYVLQGRYLFVNERAIDIGVVDSLTMPTGFGSGKYDPSQDINTANIVFDDVQGRRFWPPNCTTADAEGVAVNPPLVDIQWMQPQAPGVYGCCYPIRPHILWPMQTYQFFFQRTQNAGQDHDRLLQEVSESSFAKPSDGYTNTIAAGVNGPLVFTGVLPLRYFQLELGILFRGGEFMPVDALEWLMRWGFPFADMWLKMPAVFQGMQGYAQQLGLAGVPKPLPPQARVQIPGHGTLSGMLGDGSDMGLATDTLRANVPDVRDRLQLLARASEAFWGQSNAHMQPGQKLGTPQGPAAAAAP